MHPVRPAVSARLRSRGEADGQLWELTVKDGKGGLSRSSRTSLRPRSQPCGRRSARLNPCRDDARVAAFCLIHPRPGPFTSGRHGRVRAGRGRRRTPVNAGQHCWKACWVQALAGSNPASSATLTCANALCRRRAGCGRTGTWLSLWPRHTPFLAVWPGQRRVHDSACSGGPRGGLRATLKSSRSRIVHPRADCLCPPVAAGSPP